MGTYVMSSESTDRERTSAQNRALHKWFRQVAGDLDQAGYEASETIKVPISFNEAIVKEYMFAPVSQALYGTPHSSELSPDQLKTVVSHLQRLFAEKFGVTTQFPGDDG